MGLGLRAQRYSKVGSRLAQALEINAHSGLGFRLSTLKGFWLLSLVSR